MNISIIGFRGAGKTTVCRLLGKNLGRRVICTDDEIEKKTKIGIKDFVKKHGWEKFREVESEVIESIIELDGCIFDTGGGAVLRNENVVNLKKNSIMILLTADPKIIKERIKDTNRPELTKKNYLDEVDDLLKEREHKYHAAADYTIDNSSLGPEEVCDLIVHYMQTELN